MTPQEIRDKLEPHFSPDTAFNAEQWLAAHRASAGHCAVVAIIIQDQLGGELVSRKVDGHSQWFNKLDDGSYIDATIDQYEQTDYGKVVHYFDLNDVRVRSHSELNQNTLERAAILAMRAGFPIPKVCYPTPPEADCPGKHLVILESPFSGNESLNIHYARAAMKDCLERGEYPFASHLLYTQPGILNDSNEDERTQGIWAGLSWGIHAEKTVVYTDLGTSFGMRLGISNAEANGRPVEYRTLPEFKHWEVTNIPQFPKSSQQMWYQGYTSPPIPPEVEAERKAKAEQYAQDLYWTESDVWSDW